MENQREEENVENWSEAVEDLVAAGDNDGAISLLETHVSKLQTLASSNTAVLQLTSALNDLANLYSSKGFSLKADDLRSRASLLKHQVLSRDVDVVKKDQNVDQVLAADAALRGNDSLHDDSSSDGHLEKLKKSSCDEKAGNVSSDDDWEAIADRAPDELLSSQCLPRVSELSLTDTKVQTPKRRGRGTFSYKKHELYCDRLSSESIISNSEYEDVLQNSKGVTDKINSSYGTRHVLVLADFPPSTKTIELEKLFQDFADRGFVIRWVNDTTALAVFRTPAIGNYISNNKFYNIGLDKVIKYQGNIFHSIVFCHSSTCCCFLIYQWCPICIVIIHIIGCRMVYVEIYWLELRLCAVFTL
ncbi:hypothetical protein I3843_13G113200 [Carya illinoinensis]|uniref:Coiled-coil domain-containing protein R3HCC1L n=1 Tax=Carya illinoinensis TaxID=32201 RepID=A0A922DBR5_CARIL|nr:hypothetical protein I3842_13G127600 [Carya illinoinensis]KAG7950450.1 hypothetical protein I3843_13G113200 [Carya illinoinensis]